MKNFKFKYLNLNVHESYSEYTSFNFFIYAYSCKQAY